jgi:hypothetical protein
MTSAMFNLDVLFALQVFKDNANGILDRAFVCFDMKFGIVRLLIRSRDTSEIFFL